MPRNAKDITFWHQIEHKSEKCDIYLIESSSYIQMSIMIRGIG